MMNAWKKCVFGAIVLSGLSLNVFAQSVSVNLKNVTVKDAIKYVQKESGYSFVYISTDLNTKNKVDVKATTLKEAVDQILRGQPVSYEIKGKNVVVHKLTNKSDSTAPKRKVKGVVKDETGAPVVGATVRESGTSNGTITDLDGMFTIEMSDKSVCEVSYIGYETQYVKVGNRSS